MTDDKPTCCAEATFDDDSPNLVCVREPGRHLAHWTADGTTFVRVGKGFYVSETRR